MKRSLIIILFVLLVSFCVIFVLKNQFSLIDNSQNTNLQSETTENEIGYVRNIYQKDGKYYVDIDYVQWISDEKLCIERYGEFNNDYCIINDNPLIRTIEIDVKTIRITESIDANGKFDEMSFDPNGKLVSISSFVKAFNYSKERHNLFNIKIYMGKIIEMDEQYRP